MLVLTGGTGFVGQWLLRGYADREEFVVPCLQQELDNPALSGAWVQAPHITYVASDFTQQNLSPLMHGARGVLHLAAARPTGDGTGLHAFLPNVTLSESVFMAALSAGITNIVNISSRSVYGAAQPPWREDQLPRPRGGYAIAKLAVEHLGDDLNAKQGARIKSLRLAQVLGVGERSGYLITALMEAAQRGEPLKVYGTGCGRREYLYVKDVCRAMMLGLDKPELSGVFNIGTGECISVLELAHAVSKAFGGVSPVELLPDKPEDTSVSLMDVDLGRQALGFVRQYPLADALADMRLQMQASLAGSTSMGGSIDDPKR